MWFAGPTGVDSLRALSGQLMFGSVLSPSHQSAEAVGAAWSGDILLLCRQHNVTLHSSVSQRCEDLQYQRLSGCLQ